MNKGISAKIIKDSVSEHSNRITTFELEYPRFIHGELMTHRMFSRNAMSSRAVPVNKMIEQVQNDPAMPVHWGKNQSGMQAKEEHSNTDACKESWRIAAQAMADVAQVWSEVGLHKQVVNRILEPFQRMKTVVTATEYDNFFELRCHEDAQPEIRVLAEMMRDCMEESKPDNLKSGEWHIPYVDLFKDDSYNPMYGIRVDKSVKWLSIDDALKVSASCCAQVSYRLLDNSVEKAIMIYDKLVESKPVHASPFEHQAKVISGDNRSSLIDTWEEGITHMDTKRNYWSGNFKGWIQYRQLL